MNDKIYILEYLIVLRMAEGMGFKVSDWVLIAALAVGGYFVYTTFIKPGKKVTGAVGDVASGLGTDFGLINNAFQGFLAEEKMLQDTMFGYINSLANLPKDVAGAFSRLFGDNKKDNSGGYDPQGQAKDYLMNEYNRSPSSPPAFSTPSAYSKFLSQNPNAKMVPARNAGEFLNQRINALVPGVTMVRSYTPVPKARYFNFNTGR